VVSRKKKYLKPIQSNIWENMGNMWENMGKSAINETKNHPKLATIPL
jgi:hypothetical protein